MAAKKREEEKVKKTGKEAKPDKEKEAEEKKQKEPSLKKKTEKEKLKEWLKKQKEALDLKLATLGGFEVLEEIEKIAAGVVIPKFTVKNPYFLKTNPDPKIRFINTPKLGLAGDANTFCNLFKNALRDAEAKKCDAVVITGNLGHIDTKRFSNLSALRSRISGIKTKPELVEDEGAGKKLAKGKVVFLTFKEKFDHVLQITKDAFVENGASLFNGTILICFGNMEESLAVYYANEKMNRVVAAERAKLGTRTKIFKRLMAKETDMKKKLLLQKQIIEVEKRRINIKGTAMNDEFKNKCREEMTKYVISCLEKVIPSAKVISVGEGAIFIDSPKEGNRQLIEIVHKPTESIHDTYFGDFMDNKAQAIAGGSIPPDISVVGGLNLDSKVQAINYALRPFNPKADLLTLSTGRVLLVQLPTCIDRRALKDLKRQGVRYADPLMQFVSSEGFNSGATDIELIDRIPVIEQVPESLLLNDSIFSDRKKLDNIYVEPNMIYGEIEGDNHIGHPWVARYKIPELPYELYHFQLVHQILYENDAPICFYTNTGDTINAQNYETWKDVHPNRVRSYKWIRKIFEIGKPEKSSWKEKFNELAVEVVRDSRVAGIIKPEDQFKEYFRTAIEAEQDTEGAGEKYVVGSKYWAKILERAKKIGLKNFGEIGIITFIEGQHSAHTFEGQMSESVQIVNNLRNNLRLRGFTDKEVSKMVRAPMFGSYSMANGLLGIAPGINSEAEAFSNGKEKFYFYNMVAQHKPAAGRGVYKGKDKGKSIKLHQSRKGTTQAYQQGRFVIRAAGDIHVFVLAMSKNTLDVVSGSQTFYDPWRAYLGLSLNNITTVILGLPKDGPKNGSIRTVLFTYEDLLEYVRKPWPIDFKKLFRNSMG